MDAFVEAAGAKVVEPVKDQFYGDRSCRLLGPNGHKGGFGTRVEEVPPDEIARRAQKLFGGGLMDSRMHSGSIHCARLLPLARRSGR